VDVYAYPAFQWRVDHDAKRLYVSGLVGNLGTVAPPVPVRVTLGVSYRLSGVSYTDQRVSTLPPVRPGEIVITEPTVARLGYFNEDNGARYLFEIIVGGAGGSDSSKINNRYSYTYWFVDPQALDAGGGLEFSHRLPEQGEEVS
jgi:hypothetical protein